MTTQVKQLPAPAKLGAFAVALAAAFALGFGAGDAVGPFGGDTDAPAHDMQEMGDR